MRNLPSPVECCAKRLDGGIPQGGFARGGDEGTYEFL